MAETELFKESRHRDRIPANLGIHSKPGRHNEPVQPGANRQPNGDPGFNQTGRIQCTRQAHQQPARHIGGTGRQRCYARGEVSAGQKKIAARLGASVGIKPDRDHAKQVHNDGC